MEWTRLLTHLRADDIDLAGGKGANLGELTHAGLPVPPGFVVLTDAYRQFVVENRLQERIEQLAAVVDPADMASVEDASRQVRALFDEHPIPAELVEAVFAAYADLGEVPVAVRSSATAEDLPSASFAGQQETYLNVTGRARLIEAVRRCWSSLWTPRALSYRARQGIPPGDVALAVVVQKLIPADVAGVLFTANPLNSNRRQLVIDASWGLGEAVVSGRVTPDHWVIHMDTGDVVEHRTATKEVMTVRVAGGTETVPVPPKKRREPTLRPAEVDAIARLGRQAARHYGAPQDVEWALVGDAPYILQARPITSLFPLPKPRPRPEEGLRVCFSFNNAQGLVAPLTPMGMSLFRQIGAGVRRAFRVDLKPGQLPPLLKKGASRLWVDITPLLRHPRTRAVARRALSIIDVPMQRALNELLDREPRLAPVEGRFPIRPRPMVLANFILQLARTIVRPSQARDRTIEAVETALSEYERDAAGCDSARGRLRFIIDTSEALVATFLVRLVPLVAVGVASRFILESQLRKWEIDPGLLQPILRSLPHNPTIEMDLELWRVSRELLAQNTRPDPAHPAVKAFLDEYGHRAVKEIDVGAPRWRENPRHILDVLATYLDHGEEHNPEAQFERGAQEAKRAARRLLSMVRKKAGRMRAALAGLLVYRLRELGGVRERPKFLVVRLLAVIRSVLLQIGEDLVDRGQLDAPDDVFFVSIPEIHTALEDLQTDAGTTLRDTVRENRRSFEEELERPAIPRLVTSEGETLYGGSETHDGGTEAGAGQLSGTPVSAGVYEGPARVILDPHGARLLPGEVLVAPGTDPAWTPLFMSAGALVMEIGGMMSHGSVVAREYGIPAVVGVPGATTHLRTGQRVRVDGENGLVTLVGEGAGQEVLS